MEESIAEQVPSLGTGFLDGGYAGKSLEGISVVALTGRYSANKNKPK